MEANPYAAPLASETLTDEPTTGASRDLVARSAFLDALFQTLSLELFLIPVSAAAYKGPEAPISDLDAVLALTSVVGFGTHGLLLALSGRSVGGWLTKTRLIATSLQLLRRCFASFVLSAWALVVAFCAMVLGVIVLELVGQPGVQTEHEVIIAYCSSVLILPPLSWAFARSRWHAPLLRRFGMSVMRIEGPSDHSG